jgi:hypothetical protein
MDAGIDPQMTTPEIKILGVYKLGVTEDIFREQFSVLYPDDFLSRRDPDIPDRETAEARIRYQLESVVLVESLVINRDERFSMDDFIQEHPTIDDGGDQAAWAEAFLTLDGSSLAVERGADMPKSGDLRITFYIHFWDASLPLQTSYGDIMCPSAEPMPQRLKELVPFEPVD